MKFDKKTHKKCNWSKIKKKLETRSIKLEQTIVEIIAVIIVNLSLKVSLKTTIAIQKLIFSFVFLLACLFISPFKASSSLKTFGFSDY